MKRGFGGVNSSNIRKDIYSISRIFSVLTIKLVSEILIIIILLGFYWLFTIIITSCYTGSIIAFVTLPMYPAVIDTVSQLLDGGYQVGILGMIFNILLRVSVVEFHY